MLTGDRWVYQYSEAGDYFVVSACLDDLDDDVSIRDLRILISAVTGGHTKIVIRLLESKRYMRLSFHADNRAECLQMKQALEHAVSHGYAHIVRALLSSPFKGSWYSMGDRLLSRAIQSGSPETVQAILDLTRELITSERFAIAVTIDSIPILDLLLANNPVISRKTVITGIFAEAMKQSRPRIISHVLKTYPEAADAALMSLQISAALPGTSPEVIQAYLDWEGARKTFTKKALQTMAENAARKGKVRILRVMISAAPGPLDYEAITRAGKDNEQVQMFFSSELAQFIFDIRQGRRPTLLPESLDRRLVKRLLNLSVTEHKNIVRLLEDILDNRTYVQLYG